ncbi:hypothetical protein PS3A_54660 [Pseudomonas sp. 3A(2025)]
MKKYSIPVILAMSVMAAIGLGYFWQGGERDNIFTWQVEPVIRIQPASDESLHVEYPTVYSLGEGKGLLYSAYGDDGRWRIKLAVATAGDDFVKQGNIFDEAKLPFKGGYAFPFVYPSTVNGKTVLNLYFSAADGDDSSRYTAIYHAVSDTGLTWSAPEKLLSDNALDPVVLTLNGQDVIVYTSVVEGANVIRSAALPSAGKAGDIHTVYSSASGFYTLGAIKSGGHPILILETEKDWVALCFNASGQLVQSSKSALLEFKKDKGSLWNGLKYGMYFVSESSPPHVYYNGITGYGAPVGGQVGVGTYDPEKLASKLNTAQCQ